MKKRSFWAVLALGLFLMAALPVCAAGQNRFTLPLTVTWGQGGLVKGKTYELTLKGLEEGCPMPEGSREEYRLKLTEKEKVLKLPEIRYESPGDYRYVLKLTREDGKQIAVYYLHVMAVNGENGEISVTAALRENDPEGAKTDKVRFVDDAGKKPEQKEPSKTSRTGSKVQTGDESATGFWAILLLLCAAGLGSLITTHGIMKK